MSDKTDEEGKKMYYDALQVARPFQERTAVSLSLFSWIIHGSFQQLFSAFSKVFSVYSSFVVTIWIFTQAKQSSASYE